MSIRAVFFDLDQTLIDDALARDLSKVPQLKSRRVNQTLI